MKKGFLYIALIASAFTSGIRIDLSGGNQGLFVNLSQIICLLICIKMCATSTSKIALNLFDKVLLLYFISNVMSSVLYSSDFQSAKTCITMATYLFIYFVTKKYINSVDGFEHVIGVFYYCNIVSLVFGLLCLLLSISGIAYENLGVTYDNLKGVIPSIRSFSYEPNLFASTTAAVGVLSFSSLLLGTKKYFNPFIVLLLVISILFAFTRTVYFSLFLALIMSLIVHSGYHFKTLVKYGVIFVLLTIPLGLVISNDQDVNNLIIERIAGMFDFESGSGAVRMRGYQIAFQSFVKHPILGNGTNTAPTEFLNEFTGQIENIHAAKGYLSGAWIQSLHDTGILGFLIVLLLFFWSIYFNYKAYQISQEKNIKLLFLGLFMGNIIISIASQLTSALFISFPWIYWGVNSAALDKYYFQRHRSVE